MLKMKSSNDEKKKDWNWTLVREPKLNFSYKNIIQTYCYFRLPAAENDHLKIAL